MADDLAKAVVGAVDGDGDEIFDGARAFLSNLGRYMELDESAVGGEGGLYKTAAGFTDDLGVCMAHQGLGYSSKWSRHVDMEVKKKRGRGGGKRGWDGLSGCGRRRWAKERL